MNNITRYEINEHGEIPISYGRYVRYEDYCEVVEKLEVRIEDEVGSYENGYDDGWYDAKQTFCTED